MPVQPGEEIERDPRDRCGWGRCRNESDLIVMGTFGLCTNHDNEFSELDPTWAGKLEKVVPKLKPHLRADVRALIRGVTA